MASQRDGTMQPSAALKVHRRLFPNGNYGVVILIASAIGMLAGSAGHSFVLGSFTEHIVADVGLPRSTVARCFTVALLASSLYASMVGAAADRVGARLLVLVAALPYAVAVACVSLARGPVSLQLAVLAVRMLGPETIDFACRLCVNQWWIARRGVAVGVLNTVGALMAVLPAATSVGCTVWGWRATLRCMAVIMGSMALVVSAFLLPKPEAYGLRPDTGDALNGTSGSSEQPSAARDAATATCSSGSDSNRVASAPGRDLSAGEALRTRGFWLLALYYLLCGGAWNALNFHIGVILEEQVSTHTMAEHMDAATKMSSLYMPLAATAAICSLGGGLLTDMLAAPRKQLALFLPAAAMASCLAALGSGQVSCRAHLLAIGVALGCYQGCDKTVAPVVSASLFGRRHNGRIEGILLVARQFSGALGVQGLAPAREAIGVSAILNGVGVGLAFLCFAVLLVTPYGAAVAAEPATLKHKVA